MPDQCKYRHIGEDDDRHREKDRSPNKLGRFEHDVPDRFAVLDVHLVQFDVAKRILGDNDPGVDKHTDRYRDARERHQIRANAHEIHEQERHQHG